MKPRHALLSVGILFLIGFVHKVVTGELLTVGNSIAQRVAIVRSLAGFAFVQHEERARDALRAYLPENIDALCSGTARYVGQTLSYATRARVGTIVVSLLLASFKMNTRPMIIGSPGNGLRGQRQRPAPRRSVFPTDSIVRGLGTERLTRRPDGMIDRPGVDAGGEKGTAGRPIVDRHGRDTAMLTPLPALTAVKTSRPARDHAGSASKRRGCGLPIRTTTFPAARYRAGRDRHG